MMLGRFRLTGRIGEGGMAEVYRALMMGPEGFERELVLKRILPKLSDTGDFKTMFIREAKISALLLHPNIVQIYEFGEADGAYFIAMESVQGVTLREALTTLRRQERAFALHDRGRHHPADLHGPRLRPHAQRPRRDPAGDRPPGHLAHQHHAVVHRLGEDPRLRHRPGGVLRGRRRGKGADQGEGQLPVARNRFTFAPSTAAPTSSRWASCFTRC